MGLGLSLGTGHPALQGPAGLQGAGAGHEHPGPAHPDLQRRLLGLQPSPPREECANPAFGGPFPTAPTLSSESPLPAHSPGPVVIQPLGRKGRQVRLEDLGSQAGLQGRARTTRVSGAACTEIPRTHVTPSRGMPVCQQPTVDCATSHSRTRQDRLPAIPFHTRLPQQAGRVCERHRGRVPAGLVVSCSSAGG